LKNLMIASGTTPRSPFLFLNLQATETNHPPNSQMLVYPVSGPRTNVYNRHAVRDMARVLALLPIDRRLQLLRQLRAARPDIGPLQLEWLLHSTTIAPLRFSGDNGWLARLQIILEKFLFN
jgi:hypothetical protein